METTDLYEAAESLLMPEQAEDNSIEDQADEADVSDDDQDISDDADLSDEDDADPSTAMTLMQKTHTTMKRKLPMTKRKTILKRHNLSPSLLTDKKRCGPLIS